MSRNWCLFPYFNEREVVDIKLHTLEEVVDHFVISEADRCYSGVFKGLDFPTQKYKDWPIRYVEVNDMPMNGDDRLPYEQFGPSDGIRWKRENHQRNMLNAGIWDMADDDLVFLSDADEIPEPYLFDYYRELLEEGEMGQGVVYRVFLPQYVMRLNWRWKEATTVAIARFCSGWTLKNYGPQKVREVESTSISQSPVNGWHFSYIGDVPKISYKIANAAHTELAVDDYTDYSKVQERLLDRRDMFDRPDKTPVVVSLDQLPWYVQTNHNKFDHLIDWSGA